MEQINAIDRREASPGLTGDRGPDDPGPRTVLWLKGLYHELVGPSEAPDGSKSESSEAESAPRNGDTVHPRSRSRAAAAKGARPGTISSAARSSDPSPAPGPATPLNNYVVKIDELVIEEGSFFALLGPSGCGKTTLLTILGLARQPSRPDRHLPAVGRFQVFEKNDVTGQRQAHDIVNLWKLGRSGREIEGLRRSFLGFALQSGELLPNLTVYENVEMPLRLNNVLPAVARQRVESVLKQFGTARDDGTPSEKLWDRRRNLPGELSGGEYQRVAIARAVAHQPHILFLDEPTNNLDPKTAGMAIKTLVRLQREEGITVVMITHDRELAFKFATHIVEMNTPQRGLGHIERRWIKGEDMLWRLCNPRWGVTDAKSANRFPPATYASDRDVSDSVSQAARKGEKSGAVRLARRPIKQSVTLKLLCQASAWTYVAVNTRVRGAARKAQDIWDRRYDLP